MGRLSFQLSQQKHLVFYINIFFVLFVMCSLYFTFSLEYFFYTLIAGTLGFSYWFFKHSRMLSRLIIVTNLFILFYFLSPQVLPFVFELIGFESYLLILLYNLVLGVIFLLFSGLHKEVTWFRSRELNTSIIGVTTLVALVFAVLFILVREPVPSLLLEYNSGSMLVAGGLLFLTAFMVAVSEQIIFIGFFYTVYAKLHSKQSAIWQVAVLFVGFHFLRLENLLNHFHLVFEQVWLLVLILYYLLLLAFMAMSVYLYSLRGTRFTGQFLYPVLLHFVTDLGLFGFYYFF